MTRTPKQLTLTAPVEFKAADASKLPERFTGTAYSGGIVPGAGVVIDVASTTVPSQMALLAEHDRREIVGLVDQSSKQGGQILVAGQLYSDMPGTAAQIGRLASRGFRYQMSVGLFDYTEESIPAGQHLRVNGRDVQGPAVILRDGKVREVSVVVLGADPDTKAIFFGANTRAREEAVSRLLADIGQPSMDAVERSVYVTMSAPEFAIVSDMLRRMSAQITAQADQRKREALRFSLDPFERHQARQPFGRPH